MPTYTVNGITWVYTLTGPSNNQVILGNGSTTGGNASTSGITNGSNLIIPAQLTSHLTVIGIDQYAFSSYSMASVTIPDTVLTIGNNAFQNCTKITSFTMGNSVTSLGDMALYGANKITTISLPNSLTSIGMGCFQGSSLTSVTIPAAVTTMGDQAFFYSSNLTTVVIEEPSVLNNLPTAGFQGCSSLTSLNIPNSVSTIGANCFTTTHADLTIAMNTKTFDTTTYNSPTITDISFFGNTSVKLVLPPPESKFVTGKVPNWLQPKSGQYNATMKGYESAFPAWCSPTSAANQLGHLVDHGGLTQPSNLNDGTAAGNTQIALASSTIAWDSGHGWGDYMLDGPTYRGNNLVPGIVTDFGWYMNTNNLGVLGNSAGSQIGSTLLNIYNGMVDFYQQVNYTNMVGMVYHFTGSNTNLGVQPAFWTTSNVTVATASYDYIVTFQTIQHEIDNNRTVMACFNGWSLNPAGHPDASNLNGDEGGIYQTVGAFVPNGEHGELYNIHSTEGELANVESYNAGLGHTVLIVGYIPAGAAEDPSNGATNWLVVRDNVTTSHKNVIIQFGNLNNLLATVYVNHTTATYNGTIIGGADYQNHVPTIHYTFDTDGTNSGSLGSSADITLGTTTTTTTEKYIGAGSVQVPENAVSPHQGAGVPQIDYNTGTTGTTISFWANFGTGSWSGTRYIYTSQAQPIPGYAEFNRADSLILNSHSQVRYFGQGTGSGYNGYGGTLVNLGKSVNQGNWHHFVITCSGGALPRTVSIYLDNVLLTSSLQTSGLADNTVQRLWLGGCYYGSTVYHGMNGYIDDFRIYDVVLNATDIGSIYNNISLPGTVTFSTNILTIQNAITANDTDTVSFELPAGEEMASLIVTGFIGTGTILYTLSASGATDITGSITATGKNLLVDNRLVAYAGAITYTLKLTANADITYTIVGTKSVDYGHNIPIIHYTFDTDGTNSGLLGSSSDITLGTTTIDTTNKLTGTGSVSLPETTASGAGVPQFDYNTGTTGHTISFWAKFNTSTSAVNRTIYTIQASPGGTQYQSMDSLWLSTSTSMRYYGQSGSGTTTINMTDIFDDNWHHFAITCSGGASPRTLSIYVDNALLTSSVSTNGLADNTVQRLWLGGCVGDINATDKGLYGNIDDFRIYDSVLGTTGISILYNKLPETPPIDFSDNSLTIENNINQNDTDAVSFVLPAGKEMGSLNVTNFVGTGTINYTISATGATDITGTFTAIGTNLLAGNPLIANAGVDITYTLTLEANAAITYTIVGTKQVDYGTSVTTTNNGWTTAVTGVYLKALHINNGDYFGDAVAISGDYAIVGATGESSNSINDQTNNSLSSSGAAYIFKTTDSGETWTQTAYLKASNREIYDDFGYSVAIYGDYVVVGARLEDSNTMDNSGNHPSITNFNSGAAYIFKRDSGAETWTETEYLKASTTGQDDSFGGSVAISGDYIIVGARDQGTGSTGAAYIFKKDSDAETWTQKAYLQAEGPDEKHYFGASVAMSGDYVIVSATGDYTGTSWSSSVQNQGAAYIFKRDSGAETWTRHAKLTAHNRDVDDSFGGSVAISGDYVIVGAYAEASSTGVFTDINNSMSYAGAAYIFKKDSDAETWTQKAYLKASNIGGGDLFGKSVAISGDHVIVGAYGESSNSINDQNDDSLASSGAAYIFKKDSDSETWTQQKYLKASNIGGGDLFGRSVAISADYVIVGANGESSNSINDQTNNSLASSGAAYIFKPLTTTTVTVTPTPLTFNNNILTIQNSINQNDTDAVSFVLPAGAEMASLNVTNFVGTGTISYTISATGATDITGTIVDGIVTINSTAIGTNMLAGNRLAANAGVDITYQLTLTASAGITYTIVGTKNVDYIATVGPVIHYTFDTGDGTNSGTLAGYHNLNIPSAFTVSESAKYSGAKGLTVGDSPTAITASNNTQTSMDSWWTTTDAFTISMWAYFKNGHFADARLLNWGYTSGSGTHHQGAWFETPTLMKFYTGDSQWSITIPDMFTTPNWHHFSFTYEGKTIKVYIDGDLYKTHTATNRTFSGQTMNTFWIGQFTNNPILNGYVDDVRIYDYALSVDDISDLYNNVPAYTTVTFNNNILTIENSIDANDTDKVGFVLPVGDEMHQLVVTNFVGTGTITYTITTGATTVKNGTFTSTGTNLLLDTPLSPGGSTYILNLTANTDITYKIIGTKTADLGTPTILVFSNNVLTIDNVTSTTDTDVIDFVLPAGYNIPELNVTNFEGTGNVSYILTTGGNTIANGTFSADSTNLLQSGFPIFALSTDVTYVLTITATATIGYTIVGTKTITNLSNYSTTHFFSSGFTEQNMIDGGVWDADSNANHFNSTYNDGFLDISGNVKVTGNILMDAGDIDLHSHTFTDPYAFTADATISNRLFVVGDVSMGDASLNIVGDISINGVMSVASYKSASISGTAVIPGSGSEYSTSDTTTRFTEYYRNTAKIKFNGDASLAIHEDPTLFFHNNDGNHIFDSSDAKASQLKWEDLDISTTGQYQIAVVGGAYITSGYQYTAHTGNVWISTNFGETWVEKTVGGGAKQWTSAMISGNGAIMTVKAAGNVLYRSTDTGATWSNISFTYADLVVYPAWSGKPGAKMVMDSVGDYLCTYYTVSTNVHRVVYSEDGGTNWTTNTNTDGPISALSISKTKKYVIILYAATSGTYRPKYSADSGATFIELTNGPSFISPAGPTIWVNDAYISDNGKVGIDGYGKNSIYNTDVTTGTITGVSPNQENDAAFSEYTKYSGVQHGICFSISASHDGRYIVVFGRQDLGPTKALMFHISYDYGANYTNVTGSWDTINTSPNLSRPLAFRFSADNNYMAAIREFDNIYVRPRTNPYVPNPNSITYFGANTTLKAKPGIEFPDGTTIYSSNKEANGTTFKASTFESMTVNGEFSSPNPVNVTSDYRIKNNVETLDEIHTVDNLRPVKYKQTQTGKNDIGFLAHELQEHYPELVEGEKDGDKMQSVNYSGLLPILINEVQQLKKQIAETRARIHSETS